MKLDISKIKEGQIISETQFYVVEQVYSSGISARMENGKTVHLGKGYIEGADMNSADAYSEVVEVTKTTLERLLLENPRVALTVCFKKQAKPKDTAAKIAALYPNKGKIMSQADFEKEAMKIATDVVHGEERIMRGRHYGSFGDGGRLQFIDMDQQNNPEKDHDTRMRLVDTRTIQWLILNDVKYILK